MAGQRNHSLSSSTMGTLDSHFFELLIIKKFLDTTPLIWNKTPLSEGAGVGQSWGLCSEAVDLQCQNAPMYRQSVEAAELAGCGVVGWGEHIWSCERAVMWEQRTDCFIRGVRSLLYSALLREGFLSSHCQGMQTRGCTGAKKKHLSVQP